jgi:hypothetical protein
MWMLAKGFWLSPLQRLPRRIRQQAGSYGSFERRRLHVLSGSTVGARLPAKSYFVAMAGYGGSWRNGFGFHCGSA